MEWETGLKLDWAAEQGHGCEALDGLRDARRVYEHIRAKAASGAFHLEVAGEEPTLAGIDYEPDKLAFLHGPSELSPVTAAKVAALQDAARELQGLSPEPRRELEPTLSELAAEHMRWWSSQQGLKETNTGNQKRATYRLFASFWGDKPLRGVRRADAARFMDGLQTLNPVWGRSAETRELSWSELQRRFGGSAKGLSSSSLNRHAASLAALWRWAEERDYCTGRNPFTSFRTRLKQGVNVKGYEAWEDDELNHLFAAPPKRADLREIILVGLFSGMRINEIASLTGDQLQERDGVRFIAVRDAKTPAGNREVPLHSGWHGYGNARAQRGPIGYGRGSMAKVRARRPARMQDVSSRTSRSTGASPPGPRRSIAVLVFVWVFQLLAIGLPIAVLAGVPWLVMTWLAPMFGDEATWWMPFVWIALLVLWAMLLMGAFVVFVEIKERLKNH